MRSGLGLQTVKRLAENSEWYGIRSLLGNANWCMFYIILGAREAGKSYSVMKYFVKQWKEKGIPFTWLRLNEASMKKMLANKAEKLIDPDIYRDFGLDLKVKGNNVYDNGKKMATVLALSTFMNDKGVALFDNEFLEKQDMAYHICLDEFQLEKNQRNQGDIAYQFVNQMENLLRSTKEKVKIFLIGNTLEEASDILTLFDFIPENFGRYKLKSKRAIIDYLAPTEAYKIRRAGTVGDILMGGQSNFTNVVDFDKTLITKKRLNRPTATIVFDKNTKFTLWDGGIIATYNGEKTRNEIAMRPYQDLIFNQQLRDNIINLYDVRNFYFRNLITQKKFQKEIKLIKPRKA
jgi:hypothetical protein